MDIRKESELRVLQHLQKEGDKMIPDDMDEHEFTAACYRLEKKGYVRLARIEGGGFEAIRMLEEGFVYLKELEMEEKEDRDELERLRNEVAVLKSTSVNKRYVMFERTRKFVVDTQYLCSVIGSKKFYDSNGYFYQHTKRRFDLYCEVNEDELVNEVNNSPLQTYFDDYKKLLNSIDIPNKDTISMSMYIQEKLTSDRNLLEDAIEIFETVVEKCGYLRNSLENFMRLYDLKDNFPKKGFLCPLFIDEVTVKADNKSLTSERNEKENTNIIHPNGVVELFSSKEDCDEFFNVDNLDCAGWARRAWSFSQKSKLYFTIKGDKKKLYDEIHSLHPKIAGIDTFTHTYNELYNSTLK